MSTTALPKPAPRSAASASRSGYTRATRSRSGRRPRSARLKRHARPAVNHKRAGSRRLAAPTSRRKRAQRRQRRNVLRSQLSGRAAMLQPKRTKFRKAHRGRRRGMATAGNHVTFGDYGLQALGPCWLTARQIEAGRRAITRYVRRGGKLWIRVFPDKPITKKPLEEAHRRLFSMRLQRETRQLTNYQELPKMKRHIARLKTIEQQRQLARAGGQAPRK